MSSKSSMQVLMVGSGEYTTGFVGSGASKSDKRIGVIGLTLFDLKKRGKVGELGICGTDGDKFGAIREHFKANIEGVYKNLDTSFEHWPKSGKDYEAYKAAIDSLPKGSAITVFTPDTTHYPISLYAVQRGIHVLVTKPAVKELKHHLHLAEEAEKNGVFVMVEHHKRFDPVYSDAKSRSTSLGDFNFFTAFMSQPKTQLETFKAWAGKDSDISYYLNSHHIDIHAWMMEGRGVPTRVTASGARGIATGEGFKCVAGTEDTITLLVDWKNTKSDNPNSAGTAIYTSSWTAPVGVGLHTNQHFYYMGAKGEINVDQSRRGYSVGVDGAGTAWTNPFYMKYSPNEAGEFDGQRGYGYISIEKFIDACNSVNEGKVTLKELDGMGLPTIRNTIITTAILEAGRKSLDEKRSVEIVSDESGNWELK